MNTKESIEFLKGRGKRSFYFSISRERAEGIIALLKRGEEDRRILKHIRVITISEQVKDIIDHTILGG